MTTSAQRENPCQTLGQVCELRIKLFAGDQSQALAAVQRLSRLFADVAIPAIDDILCDPMLATNDSDFARIPGIAVRLPM